MSPKIRKKNISNSKLKITCCAVIILYARKI